MSTALRREREKEARRQAILDAAGEVFLEQGISTTTMEQVARRAELSKGTIYLYFSSKEELCLALLVEAAVVLGKALVKARDPGADPFDQIVALVRSYYEFYKRRPDYFRLLFVLEHQPYRGQVSEDLRRRWTEQGHESMGTLAAAIAEGVERGLIRACDPATTAVSLWAAVTGVIVLPTQEIRWDFVGDIDQEQLLMSTLENFWSGIRARADG